MAETIVQVQEGKLQGKIRHTNNQIQYFSFKGIPYAKPPVGDLRFAAPQPPESWEGIRDATSNCNICAQFDKITRVVVGDEDCLYLNVYTPKLPTQASQPLPVMVFYHGGGFAFGNGTDDTSHGPDYLVEKDVVVVSLNYRLGILGFLNLNRKEASGNMGLKDQVQALKWVQKNIAQFSGDPKNVTIFGVSAGGSSVEYLMLSPLAKGLFHKALAQSGSSLLHWAQEKKIKEMAFKVPELKGQKLTDEDALFKYLKNMPIKDLIETAFAVFLAKTSKNIKFGFVPSIEKSGGDWEPFMDKSPYLLLKQGHVAEVPFLSGFTSREGLLMMALGAADFDQLVQNKDFVNYLPFDVDEEDKPEMSNKLKTIYLDGKSFDDPKDFAVDFFTDTDFMGGVYVSTSLIAKRNSPVYFYEFAYDGGLNYLKKKLNITEKGACHGDDTGYIVSSELLSSVKLTESDKLVRDRMSTMWTNFAKHGDPTPSTDKLLPVKWERVSESGWRYLHITDQLTLKDNLLPERTKLYNQLYDKYSIRE